MNELNLVEMVIFLKPIQIQFSQNRGWLIIEIQKYH